MENSAFQEIVRISFRNLLRAKRVFSERLLENVRKMNQLEKDRELIDDRIAEIDKMLADNEKACSLPHGEEDCPDCGYSPKK